MSAPGGPSAELVAVVVAVDGGRPLVLASGEPPRLPAGPLRAEHDSLQEGVRAFAVEQAGHVLGHVEQLYTFGDPVRGGAAEDARWVISIGYLGLTRAGAPLTAWTPLYDLLPWEDHRAGAGPDGVARGDRLVEEIDKALRRWAGDDADRRERASFAFGLAERPWRPELALQRYELLWEAGLVAESAPHRWVPTGLTGEPMALDHRRILATGLSRLRATIQYRPVVFELLPETFTLGRLQEVVEAVAGQLVHKQNFRRVVEQQDALVEPTDEVAHATGGRPARLYRFRREVLTERAQVGTKLPRSR